MGVQGTDTIKFIHQSKVLPGVDVTYATFVMDFKPLKTEQHRVRVVVGSNRLKCLFDTGSPATSMLETKLLVNSTISDAKKGARFMGADIKDYFLASPMKKTEYIKVKYKYFPEEIWKHYNLPLLVTQDNYIYIQIRKGMYGLKQAALLAYDNLQQCLKPHGYTPVIGTHRLWEHKTRRTKFVLCVDAFGIKYFKKEDAEHLLTCPGKYYTYTTDWEEKNHHGFSINWHYDEGYVDISMPGYVRKSLKCLCYQQKVTPQYSPHKSVRIRCGKKTNHNRQY